MVYGTQAFFEELREIAFGDITSSYQAVGTATTVPVRILAIQSSMDTDMYISFDGTTDQLRVFAGSGKVFDLMANKVTEDGLFLPKGTTFYVKEATPPSSGVLAIEVAAAVRDA